MTMVHPAGENPGPWLTVQAAGKPYGLPLSAVVEVLRAVALTRIPGAPGHLAGLCLYRGQPALCLHLRAFLGAGAAEVRLTDRLVLLRIGAHLLGLLVDDALEVVLAARVTELDPMAAAPAVRSALEVDFRLLPVLDPGALIEQGLAPLPLPVLQASMS